MLSQTILRTVSIIIALNLIFVETLLPLHNFSRAYAQSFSQALQDGNDTGSQSVFPYNPNNVDITLQGKGLGTSSEIVPQYNQAQSQQNNYQGYYSNPGSMSSANTDTEVGDYVNTSYQDRLHVDLSNDPAFGDTCLQTNANGVCTMWSVSTDIVNNTYKDCSETIVPTYDAPPSRQICNGANRVQTHQCTARMFANIQSTIVDTPCNVNVIDYQPGQIYAVCKDYYDYSKRFAVTSNSKDDCICNNHQGAFCSQPPNAVITGSFPAGATLMGRSYENFRNRGYAIGWDFCDSDSYDYYTKYRHSVIERVFLQYDAPCGSNLDQWAQQCSIDRFEHCDQSGSNCITSVLNGEGTGQPSYDPARDCNSFSGSAENYQICLNHDNVTLDIGSGAVTLTQTSNSSSSQSVEWGNTVHISRVYGGTDVKSYFNNWYSNIVFNCRDQSNDCQALIDQGCIYYSHKCLDTNCDQMEYTYNCGGTGQVQSYQRAYTCTGDIRCMGSDCKNTSYTANTDFASAAAAMEVLNQYRADGTATEIFPGEEELCQSNPKDCCKSPDSGISIADYVNAGRSVIDAYSMMNGGLQATWATYADTFTYLSTQGQFGQMSIGGLLEVNSTGGSVNTVVSTQELQMIGQDAITKAGHNITMQSNGQAVISSSSQTVSALSTVATVITIAYTIYSICKFIYDFVYQCDADDYQTSAKNGMRICHEVGEKCVSHAIGICTKKETVYCCFNSVLARVLHEQARPLIGRTWGTTESPDCGGFTPGELASIDFSQVDLSEYMQYVVHNTNISPAKRQQIMLDTQQSVQQQYP